MFKVTVGIPFYNAERYLADTISSVLNQSYKDWCLILLDDGSTDSSLNIARVYQSERVRVLSDGINRGLVYRLNQLTEMVSTPYYARMDSDDIMHIDRLLKQINYLEVHPDIDVVGSSVYYIDGNNRIYGKGCAKSNPMSKQDVLKGTVFFHPTIMGRTEWFKMHRYDEASLRMEDYELWLRSIESSRFANISEPLLYYREAGLPYLNKYLLSQKGIRRLLNKELSGFQKVKMISYNYLKCFLFSLISFFKIQNIYFQSRHVPLIDSEYKSAEQDLIKAVT